MRTFLFNLPKVWQIGTKIQMMSDIISKRFQSHFVQGLYNKLGSKRY